MTQTEELIQKSQGKLMPYLDYGDKTDRYTVFNNSSVECEVGELLYAFVRILKPNHILETGTNYGVSASYISLALKDNKFGKLTTIENDPEFVKKSQELINILELNSWVEIVEGSSLDYDPKDIHYELLFLDSNSPIRFKELVKFYPNLVPGGFIFLHDLNDKMYQPYGFSFGAVPKELLKWVKTRELVPFHFPSPRGLTAFYKRKFDSFKWTTTNQWH